MTDYEHGLVMRAKATVSGEETHQVRGRFDDLDGFSQGSRHGGQLVPDLLRRHVLQERTDRRILFGRVVQVGAEAQRSRRVVDPDLQEASGSRDALCKKTFRAAGLCRPIRCLPGDRSGEQRPRLSAPAGRRPRRGPGRPDG